MDFVVLSSSRGTTLQAVLDSIANGTLTARCLGLVSDREDRGCVEKARAAGIAVAIVEKKSGETREAYDMRLDDSIRSFLPSPAPRLAPACRQAGSGHPLPQPASAPSELRTGRAGEGSCIAALGWMYILSPWFVQHWKNRIINVHPALLPKYPGCHAVPEALASGDPVSGMTIHLIDEGVDTGPILLQKSCPILPGDTEETLKERIQELEKEWYPKVLQMIERGEMRLP